jgi:hypothetical protein
VVMGFHYPAILEPSDGNARATPGPAPRLPAVSTQLRAKGLEGEHGKHLLLADSPEGCRLVRDRQLQETLAFEGDASLRERYSREKIECRVHNLAMAISALGARYHLPPLKKLFCDLGI